MKSPFKTLFVLIAALLVTSGARAASLFPGLTPYSMQMHIHGLSNHNGSRIPATMQLQSALCNSMRLDVLWWSDHGQFFSPVEDLIFHPGKGRVNPGTLQLKNIGLPDTQYTHLHLQPTISGVAPFARLDRSIFRFGFQSRDSSEWEEFSYVVQGGKEAPKGFDWARPLTTPGVVLRVNLDVDPTDADTVFSVLVDLACHHQDGEGSYQQQIEYRLVPTDEPATKEVIDSGHVLVTVPAEPGSRLYALDLSEAAALLPDGGDNIVNNIRFVLRARNGKAASAGLGSFTLHTRVISQEQTFRSVLELARLNQERYGIAEFVGIEYGGKIDSESSPPDTYHLNGFFPADELSYELNGQPETKADLAAWIGAVHSVGGLASLNHPFWYAEIPKAEKPSYFQNLLADIRENDAWGADIMEVGYIRRGGADLREHLDMWDSLTARGIFLVGNGTTDSHGNLTYPSSAYNPFVTWVWAEERTPVALLDGLRRGRVLFGDPNLWDGKLAFSAGTALMGDMVATARDSLSLEVEFTPWPEHYRLHVVQGLIDPASDTVTYLLPRTRLDRENPTLVLDTRADTFVRLEVYRKAGGMSFDDPEGQPVLFSNPIVIFHAPSDGSPLLPPIRRQVAFPGTTTEVPVTLADADTPLDALTLTAASSNQDLLPDANIAVSGAGGGRTLSLTPLEGLTGTVRVTLRVSDGTNECLRAFDVTVTKKGLVAPERSFVLGGKTVLRGTLAPTGSTPAGVTYRIVDQPERGSVRIINSATGQFRYTPSPGFTGKDQFTFITADATRESSLGTITIKALPNRHPIPTDLFLRTALQTPVSGTLSARDPDGDPLQFRLLEQPEAGTVTIHDASSGAFTFTPTDTRSTNHSFSFVVTDGQGGTGTGRVYIGIHR